MSVYKLRKKLIYFFIGIAALLIAANLFGGSIVGGVMEEAVGAPVKSGSVYLNVFTSKLGLYGFEILTPKKLGFKQKKLAEIREITVHYDLGTVFSKRIHFPRIRIVLGDIHIEKNKNGKVNLMEIGAVKNMFGKADGKKTGSKSKPKKPGPEIQIDEALVNVGKVYYLDESQPVPISKEFNLNIRDEQFRNVPHTPGLVKDISFLIMRKIGASSFGQSFMATVDSFKRNFF